jgi:hypothetical protein
MILGSESRDPLFLEIPEPLIDAGYTLELVIRRRSCGVKSDTLASVPIVAVSLLKKFFLGSLRSFDTRPGKT